MNDGRRACTAADMALRRKEILKILETYAYGVFPSPVPVLGELMEQSDRCCSGNARELSYRITCKFDRGSFSFPMKLFLPNASGKKPLIVVMNFRPSPYDEYIPVEEIIDNGFALAHLYYGDVTPDDADFSAGLAAYFPRNDPGAPGKISLWAWSISRALDVLLQHKEIDVNMVGVIGHSRLGKTSLWCAANDERIGFVCSNDSGCMGASMERTRHEGGETVKRIAQVFPYWFCTRFQEVKDDVSAMPFDQHFLLACIAPRYLLVNSASKDQWADPASEQICCEAASAAWKLYGRVGFAGSSEPYGENEGDLTGDIAYYKRYGIHFLGRKDWQNFMCFMKSKG